jgi:hypothetical protein
MTSVPVWLASRTIMAVKADGQAMKVMLRIGFPYEVSTQEWACPVAIDGMQGRLADIRGIDAWQALQLGQSLQAQLLADFVAGGGMLFCHETSEPITVAELFTKVRPSA